MYEVTWDDPSARCVLSHYNLSQCHHYLLLHYQFLSITTACDNAAAVSQLFVTKSQLIFSVTSASVS